MQESNKPFIRKYINDCLLLLIKAALFNLFYFIILFE